MDPIKALTNFITREANNIRTTMNLPNGEEKQVALTSASTDSKIQNIEKIASRHFP